MKNKKRTKLMKKADFYKKKQPSEKTACKLEVRNGVITQYADDGSIRVTLGPL
ncbi:hypothetical protein [Rahnella inusitata]|uniref:hypothetical protein n=1 Tax=Rahnella inusitata TaxID=58169 RepID=UPI0039AFC157